MKKIILPALLLVSASFFVFLVAAMVGPSSKVGGYDAGWKTVDSLAKKGLYKSANETVLQLYQKARTEGNGPQVVKAALYRSRFQSMEGRDGLVTVIEDLEKDCNEVPFPANPVLHSILADIYWRYYEQNRWRFMGRSETSGISESDIRTWDLQKILARTVYHYRQSLEPADALKLFPVDAFELVITEGKPKDSRELRPLLYDFLAHRALDFYSNTEAGLADAADGFDLNKQSWFVNAAKFADLPITSTDTLDFSYRAMKLFQQLTRLHLRDPNHNVLIDLELKRLRYLRDHATVDQQDTIYMACLRNIANEEANATESTRAFYEMALLYEQFGNQYNMGADAGKKLYFKKAEDVCNQAISRFPYSQGGLQCKELKERLNQKLLNLTAAMAYAPDENLKARLEYRNIQKVFVRLVQNTSMETGEPDRMDEDKKLKRFLKMPLVREWNVTLPADDDKQGHATELKADSLKPGSYVMLVASDPSFTREKQCVSVAEFYVSNIAFLSRSNSDGQLEVQVSHRASGIPMPGVTVNSFLSGYDYTTRKYESKESGTYTTDNEGRVLLPPLNNYQNIRLEFIHGNDRLYTRESFYQHPVQPQVNTFSEQTHFFTDRSIFRPGQTIYFKGLILRTNGEECQVMKKQKTVVQFFDANGQPVSTLNLVTNDYGTFQGTFAAPSSGLTGTMSISNESGSANFSVEEYKRPKFEVTFEPVTGAFRLGEDVNMRATAATYSGAVVDGAKVRYKVSRRMKMIDWPWWKTAIYPVVREMTLSTGTAVTDANGKFNVKFEARPDFSIESSDPAFIFTVTADVTDANGETRTGTQQVEISYQAVHLSTNLPDQVQKENRQPLIIRSENCAGQPEPIKGEAIIYRLKQPQRPLRKSLWTDPDKPLLSDADYEKYFPLDERNHATDPLKWKKEKEVFRVAFDLKKDSMLQAGNMDSWDNGFYLLELHAKDRFDEGVHLIRPFVLYGVNDKKTPVVQPLWMKAIRSNAEPGGSDSILLATGENDLRVLYELEQKGKVVKRQWITLNKEQKIVAIPIEESYRGNVYAHFTAVKNNREYRSGFVLNVPWTNKALTVSLTTFRNKTEPGSKEEWNVVVKGKDGNKATAEMLASMYDASLDAFVPHRWYFDIYPQYGEGPGFVPHTFGHSYSSLFCKDWNTLTPVTERTYDALNWFGFESGGYFNLRGSRGAVTMSAVSVADEAAAPSGNVALKKEASMNGNAAVTKPETPPKSEAPLVKVRSNFNETVFFYPQLHTNEKGEIAFPFILPDALTRWKAQFFAHTEDLKFGLAEQEIITQKELMVFSNAPRFVREGDTLELPVKVSSLSDSALKITATIKFNDALTGKDLTAEIMGRNPSSANFSVPAKQSSVVGWKFVVPRTVQALSYTVTAASAKHSDGETLTIPVLPDRMLITETVPFSLRPNQNKSVRFTRLQQSNSATLQHQSFALEYTGNPTWLAIQALPYLMEYPYECSEQVFSRYYANTLATHIVNSSPVIKSVFEQWKQSGKEAFLSNLEKNQELKNILLEESPWVRDAAGEKEQKQRIALLFDLNKMSGEATEALNKLMEQQSSNGGWAWFKGLPEDRYITQYIVEGFGHLAHLKVLDIKQDERINSMMTKAIAYCDQRLNDDYQYLIKNKTDLSKRLISSQQIHYLYARSFFPDVPMESNAKKAFQFYTGQSVKFWLENDLSLQGMIALASFRRDETVTANDIIKSLRERSKTSEEMGMYWPSNESGFSWSQAPVETQAVLMEAFSEIANDKNAVDEMKLWLLKNKQTNRWKTTKATAEACYAMLLTGSDWLSNQAAPVINIGGQKMDIPTAEAGTGYFKQSWAGSEVNKSMASVDVKNQNNTPAWGALYWQYFENMDKITSDGQPLRIARKLFVERNGKSELITDTTTLHPGDRIKIRVIIQTDRDMEYVHVKDLRAAGFEPEHVLSGSRYQDGLGYYESTRDAATNMFIGFLPKGMYVFEYPVRAAQRGSYSNGVATIQCMYAPEFSAHSDGFRVTIAGE